MSLSQGCCQWGHLSLQTDRAGSGCKGTKEGTKEGHQTPPAPAPGKHIALSPPTRGMGTWHWDMGDLLRDHKQKVMGTQWRQLVHRENPPGDKMNLRVSRMEKTESPAHKPCSLPWKCSQARLDTDWSSLEQWKVSLPIAEVIFPSQPYRNEEVLDRIWLVLQSPNFP